MKISNSPNSLEDMAMCLINKQQENNLEVKKTIGVKIYEKDANNLIDAIDFFKNPNLKLETPKIKENSEILMRFIKKVIYENEK